MRKYLAVLIVLAAVVIFLPSKTQAQGYHPYIYTNNAYMNYALASARAKRTRAGKKSRIVRKRNATKRKSVRRRVRRVSMLENVIEQKFNIESNFRRASIV